MYSAAVGDHIELRGSAGKVRATVVGIYEPGEDEETSAPTIRNMAIAVFRQVPVAHRVVAICTRGGVPMLIIEAAHQWFDVEAARLEVVRA